MDIFILAIISLIVLLVGAALFLVRRQNNQINKKIDSKSANNTQITKQSKLTTKSQDKQNIKKQQQKNKQKVTVPLVFKPKKLQQLQTEYEGLYFGSFKLKSANSIHSITALDFKGSKILLATTKNQLILYNLKTWKKDIKHSIPQKYFVSLDNNGASAVCIGQNYYYVALTFDKTISYYQFIGQNGIYFKEIQKFPRNILKSNASAIHVSKLQNYIITTGTGADTVIDIWSMKGQKIISMNTFQIQHYYTSCGNNDILIRGWTSEAKIFQIQQTKQGHYKKLQKKQHLTHQQSPLSAAIDNRDMYAISISKHHKVKIWNLYDITGLHRTQQSNQTYKDITQLEPNKCAIYTFQSSTAIGHFKTLVVLINDKGFIITDVRLRTIKKIQGIQVKDIYLNGTNKSVILGTVNYQGQISLWNLTKELDKVEEVKL